MKNYWIERTPKENETVKVEFADFTNLGTKIGVFLGNSGGKCKVDFGDCTRLLSGATTWYVYDPKNKINWIQD